MRTIVANIMFAVASIGITAGAVAASAPAVGAVVGTAHPAAR